MTRKPPLKYLKHDGNGWKMQWRHPFSRFGCDQSRRMLSRFPRRVDDIARLMVEAGSRLRAGKAVRRG